VERLRVTRGDAILALGLLVLGQVELWVFGTQAGSKLLTVPALVAMTVPLAWRRRAPLAVLSVPFTVLLVEALAAPLADASLPRPTSAAMLAGWVIAVYSTGAHAELPWSLAGAVMGFSFLPISVAADSGRSFDDIEPVSVLFILIPWATGLALRRQRAQALRLRVLADRLDREREERARAAVIEERTRIARELHDEIAHSVSVIAVQADAAEGALERDPGLAREPLAAIKTTARSALVEMRRLLGVLREAGEAPTLSPPPGLAQLGVLVEQARRTGLVAELRVEGQPVTLPAGLDATAYRIVQEGLTNVRKHAGPAQVRVVVGYGMSDLELEVRDDGRGVRSGDGAGHGLLGVRERVALYGGEMHAGPAPGGGYLLRARLPLESAAT
jgi:signal transduction histidine kinase